MRFVPLDGSGRSVDWATAIDLGTAPDGSLWVPDRIDRSSFRGGAAKEDFGRWASTHAATWLDESVRGADIRGALDLPVCVRPLGDRIDLLDLTGGPTAAFKDVGARFLARLWAAAPARTDVGRTVLVATSGDTGGAVAAAVAGAGDLRAIIVYPEGRVSAVQRREFTTRGPSVLALSVEGTFDECQAMVRSAFAAPEHAAELGLVSANSINPGRLMPQVLYHAWGAYRRPGRPLLVPSGNLGNVTAATLARAMGAPIASVHAVVNENDALVRATTGEAPRTGPARATDSNAMDVARPSNLDRLRWLAEEEEVSLRELVAPVSVGVDAARAAQRRAWEEHEVMIDPHTAVAVAEAFRMVESDRAVRPLVVETAHPGKFPDVVSRVLGVLPPAPCSARSTPAESTERVEPSVEALFTRARRWLKR